MTIRQFCSWIGMPKDVAKACADYPFEDGEVIREYNALKTQKNTFLERNNLKCDTAMRYLALFVRFGVLTSEECDNRLISRSICHDTLADIAIWQNEYYEKHDAFGLDEVSWLINHIRLDLFQLGSLQFQPVYESVYALPEYTNGVSIFCVHIPKGADLSTEAIESSCQDALLFWQFGKAVFTCDSWLLSPAFKEFLPASSHISQFANRFTILKINNDTRKSEEHIFGKVCANAADYRAETSLQKAAKKHLLGGGTIPSAAGYFVASIDLQRLSSRAVLALQK